METKLSDAEIRILTADEAIARADRYADEMSIELEMLARSNPTAQLDFAGRKLASERLAKGPRYPGPKDLHTQFRSVFLRYLNANFLIVPDEEAASRLRERIRGSADAE